MASSCRICGESSDLLIHKLCETMYGMDETFEYFECTHCGTLQIKDIPDDLGRYYDESYNSFQNPPKLKDNRVKAFLKRERAKACLGSNGFFRSVLQAVYRPPEYFDWFKGVNVDLDSNILDVGCGAGNFLIRLKKEGFKNLYGLDKYISKTVVYENGVSILKSDLEQLDGRYDYIMLHHSFEHMPEPERVLKKLFELLRNDRFVMIRIPVFGNFIWQKYKTDWVQLDAPRHLFLYSENSMRLLAESAGFSVKSIVYDSNEFQFWGSEQCRKDIALFDKESFAYSRKKSIFTKKMINKFKKWSITLNEFKLGDQACFYLYKQ
ncbi:MAG: class I SAM-dependent methyltransferase [Desulfobacter sp.]|nr:MAG: class I SAM-dependent methyltransferase [Desulfobacter sp.]